MKNYQMLQNGSDIRGIAITGVEGELPNLTADEAAHIAAGFLIWLSEKKEKAPGEITVAIGRDPRVSGKSLLRGLTDGFGPYGVKILDCGLASTPAMFMATIMEGFKCDGSVMITASHLPYNRNGFKFFTEEGGLDKADIKEILSLARDEDSWEKHLGRPSNENGYIMEMGRKTFPAREADIMTPYCAHLRNIISRGAEKEGGIKNERPLEGLKIAVDAGNGGGGFFASRVLEPLGADISGSQFLTPDGTFPHHAPNPEDAEAMEALAMRVLSTGSDLGLMFDTDVDRSAAVDGRGRQIARNGIVAMAAAIVSEDYPGSVVVTDSITSRQLTGFLQDRLGLEHHRFKRGYRNVINEGLRLNREGKKCGLAIETSGHAAFLDNYFLDDGAYLAARIVVKAAVLKRQGRNIDSLIEALQEPADEREVRIPVKAADFASYGDMVLKELEEKVRKTPGLSLEEPNYEGVRVNFPEGWCLLRKSLHDPILPMNMASDKEGGCEAIMETMKEFLLRYTELDLTVL
ncbi:MAG TPA: phosphomannomutase/phosphoglucomutase [Candidatus Copromorpha excrementigallinarum]|uniref:Phosphomannomutase/phosphoglucomutase n=1 Tax=Candidatus Allocopromorpha excrementigallinarum TaxID=2840742 RepID=A0A9D1L6V1_9FIRM|nr:phosphomannomutase/phosphoglucomutase [Candidatus Copromorpha excrementigallinarum]